MEELKTYGPMPKMKRFITHYLLASGDVKKVLSIFDVSYGLRGLGTGRKWVE
jgi:hypothetical protein